MNTPQQSAIISRFASGASFAVRARAGTGKTTTLVEAFQRAPEGSLALAFNNRVEDAEFQAQGGRLLRMIAQDGVAGLGGFREAVLAEEVFDYCQALLGVLVGLGAQRLVIGIGEDEVLMIGLLLQHLAQLGFLLIGADHQQMLTGDLILGVVIEPQFEGDDGFGMVAGLGHAVGLRHHGRAAGGFR